MPKRIPERIGRLTELSKNIWWSWHHAGREIFRRLDYPLWRYTSHNPVMQLEEISQSKLEAAAEDPIFLKIYDKGVAAYETYLQRSRTWSSGGDTDILTGPVAYFSMEYALHASLPIYAGGLGVLAGDLCKEASDIGLPMSAVGFMYPQGYFRQLISKDGWQEERYQQLDFNRAPITPIYSEKGDRCLAEVILKDHTLHIGAWLVQCGNTNLYLLDTSLEENPKADRELSNRLYTADREHRLQQEILLGIGGVRVLRRIGVTPALWHANEGHTAFMMVERIREETEKGLSFSEALEKVSKATVFTTHTPVPAGHDVFSADMVTDYFRDYRPLLGIDNDTFLSLGQVATGDESFNMTILSLKTSSQRNAVSQLHGEVTRRMWHNLWPDRREEQVPIGYITNGIHIPTWLAHDMEELFNTYLGSDWMDRQDDPETWRLIDNIPDDILWDTHLGLKRRLFHIIMERAQKRWAGSDASAQQIISMGSLLDQDAMTIAFSRRFAEYKRPSLVFKDIDRITRLINDSFRPVQFIFAGKSHPADHASKMLLQYVHTIARERNFQGRIAFLEDYDIRLARYLCQGIDVWLNVPRRLKEASGTSGMKACLNGALHLSVPDGWWYEGYDGENGWSIGDETRLASTEEEE